MTLHFLSPSQLSEIEQIVETFINFEPISSHDMFVLQELFPLLEFETAAIGDDKTSLTPDEKNIYYLHLFSAQILPFSNQELEDKIQYITGLACCAYFSNQIPSFLSHWNNVISNIQEPQEWDKKCLYILFKCWINILTDTNITTNIDMIYTLRQNQIPLEKNYIDSLSQEEKSQSCKELVSYYHLLKATESFSLQILNVVKNYDIEASFQQSSKILHYNINIEIFRDWINKTAIYILGN